MHAASFHFVPQLDLIPFLRVQQYSAQSHATNTSGMCALQLHSCHDDSSKFRTCLHDTRTCRRPLLQWGHRRAGYTGPPPISYFHCACLMAPLRFGALVLHTLSLPHGQPFQVHFLFQNVDHENSLSHIPSIKSRVSDQHGHARACAQSARA
jgi:hypothetical protein